MHTLSFKTELYIIREPTVLFRKQLAISMGKQVEEVYPSVMVQPPFFPFSSLSSFLPHPSHPLSTSDPICINSEAYSCNYTMSTVRLALD